MFPIGGGAMGQLVSEHDWAATSLGAIDTWPEALRTTLNLILNSPESMYLVWGEELLFFFNDAYRPILGPRLAVALGRPLAALWADAYGAVRPHLETALAGGAVRLVDTPIRMQRYGVPEQTWWSYSYSPLYDGDRVAGVLCFTTETTARVQEQQYLEGQAVRHHHVLEGMPGLLWTADAAGRVTYEGDQVPCRDATGTAQEPCGWPDHLHPQDAPATMAAWMDAVASHLPFEAEYRLRAENGAYRWYLGRAVPQDDDGDRAPSWVGVCMELGDIVARRAQLEEDSAVLRTEAGERAVTLAATESALRQAQKMEGIGQLASGLAHDFNNLLQCILTALEMAALRVRGGDDRALHQYVGMAESSARRAAALTARLLALARSEEPLPVRTDINRVIGEMGDLLRRTVGDGIDLALEQGGDLPDVLVDPPQLENALLNLCINARDAMAGAGVLRLSTTHVVVPAVLAATLNLAEGGYVRLSVADTGAGMSARVLARASEPFFTTKPVGQGTGLGLSMVRRFARHAGGGLQLLSESGVGTTALVYLPSAP
ncbi:signal transduction histidine kinase [Pseudoduganella lurida]|uniref:histidine kinase n=1 Tax=Pseudoduganella lurida TaxID=1036180 RepID=A0A562RJT4_9BURK|nr:hybrid sensor histidine kinase/response regulator [Pseudoduganella lurida]TWI69271.1 signal transduction histidine kinase [Pseudoduganella lurida]